MSEDRLEISMPQFDGRSSIPSRPEVWDALTEDSRLDQSCHDDHVHLVEPGQTTPQATDFPIPIAKVPAGSPSTPSTITPTSTNDSSSTEPSSPPAIERLSPVGALPVVDPLLFVHVTTHGDIEQIRIASQHRLRILTATEPDEDGVVRGFGLDQSHPDVARLEGITEALQALEHGAELNLKRALRKCAIHPWVKAQVGLGEKQVARLLGAIGDPYWHLAEDRPRTVSELWAYCGLHVLPASHCRRDTHLDSAGGDPTLPASHTTSDTQRFAAGGAQTSDPGPNPLDTHVPAAGVAARRRKGQKANWSTDAKTRAYLIATSCIKQDRSPYRTVYLARREHTAITHPDWTAGHSHNDALRVTSKAVLRDLWREAKRLHTGGVS